MIRVLDHLKIEYQQRLPCVICMFVRFFVLSFVRCRQTITDVNNYKEHFAAKHPKLVCDVAKFQAQLTAAGK